MFNIRLHWLGVGLWFRALVLLLILKGVGQQEGRGVLIFVFIALLSCSVGF